MSGKPRLVFDTNVIVSAALFEGSMPWRAVERAVAHGTTLMSDEAWNELTQVLRREKLNRYAPIAVRIRYLRRLSTLAERVEVRSEVNACRDPRDDKFLALALDGKADCIVSGDRDLLALHPFRGIPILAPAVFLNEPLEAD